MFPKFELKTFQGSFSFYRGALTIVKAEEALKFWNEAMDKSEDAVDWLGQPCTYTYNVNWSKVKVEHLHPVFPNGGLIPQNPTYQMTQTTDIKNKKGTQPLEQKVYTVCHIYRVFFIGISNCTSLLVLVTVTRHSILTFYTSNKQLLQILLAFTSNKLHNYLLEILALFTG